MISATKNNYRPGFELGAYPQRTPERKGWFDPAYARISRFFTLRLGLQHRRMLAFARDVNAIGERLSDLSEEQLGRRIHALRFILRRDGLASKNLPVAFAIVREVATRVLGLRHYDEQIMAGRILIDGMLCEMETGEGKTLMATLPASVAALAGIPVHVITVNDYLVQRDAEQMSPLYRYLGLSTGIASADMAEEERRTAYETDITYTTNKILVFDYLRDRLQLKGVQGSLSLRSEKLYAKTPRLDNTLLQGLCFCIVDEADSVLIDEVVTPLVLSQGGEISEQDVLLYQQAVQLARSLTLGQDFIVDERLRQIKLTATGLQRIQDFGQTHMGQWKLRARCEELAKQALSACHLFKPDREYLVNDDEIGIIDDSTGRIMADRKWERGLHQMIEVKEGCTVTPPNEVLARISYQTFFQRYLHLSGMTGTASETAAELRDVYGLKVVKIPTHRKSQLQHQADQLFATQSAKWNRIVARVIEVHKQQRPILVGTRSVADSEMLSRMLDRVGLPCQVLNARQNENEAQMVAQAGQPGTITIATNMAGRGTDIPLCGDVEVLGGLHVIAAERNTARRIDRQLFGRSGRQGAPGSCESILALDDRIVSDFCPQFLQRLAARKYANSPHPLPKWLGIMMMWYCQHKSESWQRRQRKALERMGEYLAKMLAYSGKAE